MFSVVKDIIFIYIVRSEANNCAGSVGPDGFIVDDIARGVHQAEIARASGRIESSTLGLVEMMIL